MLGNGSNGYVEFSPKRTMLMDDGAIFHAGKVSFGSNGRRYNRSATITVSKTTACLNEAMYSQGASYNEPDTNITNNARMFVLYR